MELLRLSITGEPLSPPSAQLIIFIRAINWQSKRAPEGWFTFMHGKITVPRVQPVVLPTLSTDSSTTGSVLAVMVNVSIPFHTIEPNPVGRAITPLVKPPVIPRKVEKLLSL
jgi:hypothetical protein